MTVYTILTECDHHLLLENPVWEQLNEMDQIQKILSESPSFANGSNIAKAEIAQGLIGWREHGKPVTWWPEAADELRERYQIRFALVGHCIATLEVAAEAAGYNQEMEEEFIRRFGTNVVNEVFRELERKKKKLK